ncbi:MAG: type II toxin-antitoxin system PemK/MazF family toxin [archaeon]|nr:type II toxin-antitoxin system PemK/MazF family toxin [archaeon]
MIEQRDLLLVPFPFSDQSGKKVRPVVVISNKEFNAHSEDLVVVGITTNTSKGKYTLGLATSDLEEGKLYAKCAIKTENMLKIDRQLFIVKKIGKISKAKHESIIAMINKIISKNNN